MLYATCNFNPHHHITAGELRRLGFYLSEILADRAYVRRIAVGLDEREVLRDGTATLRLNVLEPFTPPVTVKYCTGVKGGGNNEITPSKF